MAADRDDAEELQRLAELHAALGLPSRWIGPRECRALEPGLSPRVRGAIHAPRDHQADPAATVRALAAACRTRRRRAARARRGRRARSQTGGSVTGVRDGDRRRCSADDGRGRRRRVERRRSRRTRPPIRPVKGQIATLRAPDPALAPAHIVRTPRCYLLARDDGRVVLGATVEERGFDASTTADGVFRLLEAAREVLPDVGELEWTGVRAGLRPGTPDNLPVVGPGSVDGLVWATGHYRNGVLLAPLTGETVASILTGREGGAMRVVLNGEPRELQRRRDRRRRGATQAARPSRATASRWPWAARSSHASGWADRTLAEGEQVEVLQAVQGG